MRIRIVEFEGTAEELVQVPELKRSFGSHRSGNAERGSKSRDPVAVSDKTAELLATISDELSELLKRRARSQRSLNLLAEFLMRITKLPHVGLHLGDSERSADGKTWMIHVRREDGIRGSFAQVDARRAQVLFRLSEDVLTNCRHAFARKIRPTAKFRVKIALDSEDSLDEAVDLTKEAYEDAAR